MLLLVGFELVDTFHLSSLPSYSLAGIAYREEDGRFLITSLWEGKLYSFSPQDPEGSLREELSFGDFFDDGFQDYFWGVECRGESLWVSVVSAPLDSAALLLYVGGSLTRAWRLDGYEGWFAGLGWDRVAGGLWAVQVGGSGAIYLFEIGDSLQPVDSVTGWAAYQRGLCAFAPYGLDTARYLLTGNWNEGMLYLVDADDTAHAVVNSDSVPGVAGVALWDTAAGDTLYAFVTASDSLNTVYKVNLGLTWDNWGVEARPAEPPKPLAFLKNGLWFAPEPVRVYSASGRFLGLKRGLLALKPGVYLLEGSGRTQVIWAARPKAR